MHWTTVGILVAFVVVFYLLQQAGRISTKAAKTHLKDGALVIDVRSPEEFRAGHLPKALNIPLDRIETALPSRVKDKNQVLLLHCRSGARSGVAKKKLQSLGYGNAFNLGSYGRAAGIVSER